MELNENLNFFLIFIYRLFNLHIQIFFDTKVFRIILFGWKILILYIDFNL